MGGKGGREVFFLWFLRPGEGGFGFGFGFIKTKGGEENNMGRQRREEKRKGEEERDNYRER